MELERVGIALGDDGFSEVGADAMPAVCREPSLYLGEIDVVEARVGLSYTTSSGLSSGRSGIKVAPMGGAEAQSRSLWKSRQCRFRESAEASLAEVSVWRLYDNRLIRR